MAFNLSGGSKEETRLLWKLAGMGFQFGTEIVAGVLLGWLVDRYFGTQPWGVVIGSLLGIAVAFLDLTRKAIRLNRDMDRMALGASKKPQAAPPAEQRTQDADRPDEELTHEQWKARSDRDTEPDENDRDPAGDPRGRDAARKHDDG